MKTTAKAPVKAPAATKAAEQEFAAATAFLHDVDDALQYERVVAFWHRHKLLLAGGVVALLLAVAAGQGLSAWQAHQHRAQATLWNAVSELQDPAQKAKKVEDFITHSSGGFQAVALASQLEAAPDAATRQEIYQKLQQVKGLPEAFTRIATLNEALLKGPAAKPQLQALTEQNLTATGTYALALEQLSLLEWASAPAMAKGYTERLLALIAIPADLRTRAVQRFGALAH